jgi:hypothetical protein
MSAPMAHRPKRRDILAICLASAIIGLLTLAAVIGAGRNTNRPFNFGFGPDMDCRNVPFGEPICIRKPQR